VNRIGRRRVSNAGLRDGIPVCPTLLPHRGGDSLRTALSTGRVEPSALIPAFGAATRMGAVTINTVLLFSLILNIARGVLQTEHRS
jgi:hypothetical protein